ncbi:hypothetical protein [Actinoplanes sp. DH11]|uniref:hypothetical protein n=1 Tax=Actinoplanes sp. DH11 TaxID=2857011 RepID=UPI001E426DDA|nr:hypothetical protein [Actinoplanes sp. DH11]
MLEEPRGTMHGWILGPNLLPFVERITEITRCRDDLSAIAAGVARSDADTDDWFDVVIEGETRVELYFAKAPDGDVLVDVELEGLDPDNASRCAELLDICCQYRLLREAR